MLNKDFCINVQNIILSLNLFYLSLLLNRQNKTDRQSSRENCFYTLLNDQPGNSCCKESVYRILHKGPQPKLSHTFSIF